MKKIVTTMTIILFSFIIIANEFEWNKYYVLSAIVIYSVFRLIVEKQLQGNIVKANQIDTDYSKLEKVSITFSQSKEYEKSVLFAMKKSAEELFPNFDNIDIYFDDEGFIRFLSSDNFSLDYANALRIKTEDYFLNTLTPEYIPDPQSFVERFTGQYGLGKIDKFKGYKQIVSLGIVLSKNLVGGFTFEVHNDNDFIVDDEMFERLACFQRSMNVLYRETKFVRELSRSKDQLVNSIIYLLQAYDSYTGEHSQLVNYYAMKVGAKLGLTPEEMSDLYYASLFHDVGKITLSRSVLNSDQKLTSDEYSEIKLHSQLGSEIIMNAVGNDKIASIIRSHHERYDGRGYPDGLKGMQIPLLSRILTVCDAFEAMISKRPYRKSKTVSQAVAELRLFSGPQFDPVIVDLFVKILDEDAKNTK